MAGDKAEDAHHVDGESPARPKWLHFMLVSRQNPWNTYLGDCSVIDEALNDKPIWSKWFLAHYLNVFLRAVGQPPFVNNPLCGAIIFASLFVQDYQVGLGCLLGGSIATIAELIFRLQPWFLMRNGVAAFNGVLTGTVMAVLYPGFYGTERTAELWIYIAVGSLLSVFLCAAFNNFLGKFNVPYLALPFNLIAFATFLSIQPTQEAIEQEAFNVMPFEEETTTMAAGLLLDDMNTTITSSNSTVGPDTGVDWLQVGRGILVSLSQVYGVDDPATSIIMNIACFLFSPLLFVTGAIGAVIGSFMGVALLPESALPEVYAGVWGYNTVLAMISLSCVFYPCNHVSSLMAVLGTAATSVVQYAMRENMTIQNNVPVFTMPFTMVGLTLLLTSDVNGVLKRVEDMSYPEKQSITWWTSQRKAIKVPQDDPEDIDPRS